MPTVLGDLKPSHLWKYFDKILKIPHCSGSEKALGDYIVSVARELKLGWERDRVGNVVVRKPATPGHEQAAGVILQGHLDMVCEKNSDVVHDFSKDAIKAELKGGWVQAAGTTLGADNGIGVAACLAVMEDTTLVHGPLEFLFTVDEETGLTGANKIGKKFLQGKKLLNLDSEDEGTFTIGCSGGADSEVSLGLERKSRAGGPVFRLKVFGFRGGHSGLDINQGRGNAIKLLARLLWQAQQKFRFDVVHIEGGNKRNAIPRESWADIAVAPDSARRLSAFFKKAFEKIRLEYKATEPEANFSFEKASATKEFPLTVESLKKLLNLLLGLPHGVMAMHPEIQGLVETSTNLAIIRCSRDQAQIICSTRSSVASALEAVRDVLKAVAELAGAKIVQPGGYSGWMPNLESPLLQQLKDLYKKTFGEESVVKAVHAGLECGILGEKFPGLDMISFGPTIEHPHSPDEHVHAGSVEKFWKFLTAALAELG